MSGPLRVAVLLSGEGTSLENLCERIDAGEVPARVVLVISSKEKAGGLARAERRGIPAVAVPRKAHPEVHRFNDAIHAELAKHAVDLVACLGFLSIFELRGFAGRAINVHPALIPAFCGTGMYGHRVHEAVLASGVKVTGATVHFADDRYDSGPIILQRAVPVLEGDTPESLAARVQAAEREIVPEAIRLFAEGRLSVDGRRVRIRPSAASAAIPESSAPGSGTR
jgi:formyltetrahydrofolate-dependent phosphoribosylglycinamide formyltransferase